MKCTLFTHYFDPELTRKYGRRVSGEVARNFSEEKLERILRDLKLPYEKKEAGYPRVPWNRGVMYIIESNVKKSTLMKIIERHL